PRSDVLINWLGITDPADWKTARHQVIAQRMAKLLLHPLPGRSSAQQPESRACTSNPGTSAQTRHHDAHASEAITWARMPNSPEPCAAGAPTGGSDPKTRPAPGRGDAGERGRRSAM